MKQRNPTNLVALLRIEELIQVADIGAAAIAEAPVYHKFVKAGLGRLFAFDGDERHIERLKGLYGSHAVILNDFICDGGEHTVYICHEDSGMTSLFRPSAKALEFFNGFKDFGEVIGEEKVATKKLDDVSEIDHIDFLKMDVQGAELSILEHGWQKLKDCIAIQLEVSFICLYENQPSFGEIDVWMRKHGFVPHRFLDVKRWSIAPTTRGDDFRLPFHQLLEADIVYIKDPLKIDDYPVDQLKKMTLMADNFFESPDLAIYCLRELVKRGEMNSDVINDYIALS